MFDSLNTLLIPPSHNLIEEIIPHFRGVGRDYSSNMVVFPGKRPSHFLRKTLANRLKGSFIPPVILSMDEFIDYVYEEKLVETKRKLETIDAVAILYDIQKKSSSPLGGDNFLTPDNFFPVGLKIYKDIEELYIEKINPYLVKEIEPFVEEGIPEQTVKRLQSLSYFYEEFYKDIENRNFSTRSLRYRTTSENIDETELNHFQQIIFVGFFALTKSEKILFRKMLSWSNTLFLFQDGTGIKERLSDLGIKIESQEGEDTKQEIHFYRSPDTHGQVFGLSRILKADLENNVPLDERTVVVLPSSETLFPLLRQGLSILDEDSYNISMGYPLYRTPVFGFLNNLMELITSMDGERVYIPDYLKFVLHPYTKNIYLNGSAETTRILFHTIEEELTQQKTKTFSTLSEIENNEDLFLNITDRIPSETKITEEQLKEHLRNIHRNTIEKFLNFKNIHDFAVRCTELLIYIFHNSTARLHPLFYPYSEAFIRALDIISRSLMKDVFFTETNSYFALFKKYIMTCHTPFEGTPIRGLQVLGFLETRNLLFDRVFILDVNEETIPDTKKEDTLFPLKAREILGLPTYMDRDKLIAYYFEILLKGAREAHLFFIENDNKEKSRFVERLLWEKQKRDKTTDTKGYLKSVQYQVNLKNNIPDEIKKTDNVIRFLRDYPYSATALDTYLKCQLQFYYNHILRIDKKEEISGDIERSDIGKFVHTALSKYFMKRKGYPLKEADIYVKEMESLIDQLFVKEYGKNPTGATYLLKRQIKSHLNDFLKNYSIPMIKKHSLTILDVECPIKISKDSFNLKGRIDCIEKRDGEIYIIDYKTSSNPNYLKINLDKLDLAKRETWSEAIGSLQLPFYLLLYSEATGKKITNLNGMFLLLGKAKISDKIELPLFEDLENTEETYEILKTIIFQLLEEIVDPSFPFQPTSGRKESCPLCNFQYICGTQWVVK